MDPINEIDYKNCCDKPVRIQLKILLQNFTIITQFFPYK